MKRSAVRLWPLLLLAACAGHAPEPPLTIPAEGARLEASIYLSAHGPDQADAEFHLPWLGAHEVVVTLASTAPRAMSAQISCTGEGRLYAAGEPGAGAYLRPGAVRRFTLPPRHAGTTTTLILPPETKRCELRWGEANHLTLLSEDIGDPVVARLDATQPVCALPAPGRDPLARVFYRTGDLSETCPRPTGAYALYPDEQAALRLRLERLTGSHIDAAVLAQGEPDMPLDFTHAPRFDEIVISYLHMRADISSYLIARTLAFHAARGTKVRIAVASALMLAKDRRLLEALAAQYPNVQIQYYRWTPQGLAGPDEILSGYQRSHHIKLFAALSPTPGQSFAMVGGRNLNDMFFFPGLTGKPRPPFLSDYKKVGNSANPFSFFHPYEDFEIALFSRGAVSDAVAQFGRFWNRDGRGEIMPPATSAVQSAVAAEGQVRHFISLPWADGQDQERLFVEMFDAAREEILMISPFTYPTPAIDAALGRAAARGVRVRLVTRLVSNEPPSVFVNGLNTEYYQRRAETFEIRAYDPGDRLMHTKIFVIDRRLAVVTSTNLNWRSFIHDSENGLIFLDRAVAADLAALVERAMARGGPIITTEATLELGQLLSRLPELEQFF